MGQYRVSTGVGIKLSLCDIFDEPIVFAPLLAGMGFPADDCPAPPVSNKTLLHHILYFIFYILFYIGFILRL